MVEPISQKRLDILKNTGLNKAIDRLSVSFQKKQEPLIMFRDADQKFCTARVSAYLQNPGAFSFQGAHSAVLQMDGKITLDIENLSDLTGDTLLALLSQVSEQEIQQDLSTAAQSIFDSF